MPEGPAVPEVDKLPEVDNLPEVPDLPGLAAGALVTLHYRIALEDGAEVISTFGGRPATLSIGGGELAPALEQCLAQAEEGRTCVFDLAPGEAFGAHREALVQTLRRAELPANVKLEEGVLLEFADGTGGRQGGLVRSVEAGQVTVDFNHPLAGRAVRFEVHVLARL